MTTSQPHEQRCARCGQWWTTTHICSVQIGQVFPLPVLTPSAPVEVTTTDKIIAERDALRALTSMLRAELQSTKDALRAEVESQHQALISTAVARDDAREEVERLRAEVESLTQQLKTGESFHAVAVQQRDAAWREAESLRAKAAAFDWIKDEHDRIDPMVRCVVTRTLSRGSGDWVNFTNGDSFARVVLRESSIDAARAAQEDSMQRLADINQSLGLYDAPPYSVVCEPVADSDWPDAHQVRIRNGRRRFDVGMHLETREEGEHYAAMLRSALGLCAAPQPPSQWPQPRPMSEAPKDVVVLAWWPESKEWVATWWWTARGMWIHVLSETDDPQPTYWLPMPPDPAEQEATK